MATPSDQQLIQNIQQGRPEAVAQLFDRYCADLYDFLARLTGDRDQAARLLEEVFMRVPAAVAGLPIRESVRGWLYSLAREAGLNWLRQKSSLDTLPPSDEPMPPGLGGDIWKAGRKMPAFHRAVLIIEELHALSPTEKARALGVQRTDLTRLVDEARKSFTRSFDAQARVEGRPTTAQIDPERILGLRARISASGTSLFTFLPILLMPDSLKQALRQRIIQSVRGQPLRAVEPPIQTPPAGIESQPAAVEPLPLPPSDPQAENEPEPLQSPQPEEAQATLPPETVVTTTTRTQSVVRDPMANRLPISALAAGIGIALAVLICALVYFLLVVNVPPPVIDKVDPADASEVQQAAVMSVSMAYHDPRGIDPLRSKLVIDGTDVTTLATVGDNSMTYTGSLGVGQHTASGSIFNRSGKQTNKIWNFSVIPAPVSLTTAVPAATTTLPIPTITSVPTDTPVPLTSTPTVTSTSTETPTPPSPTPCFVGISGTVFDDVNGNQFFDSGEPSVSGVVLSLQDPSGIVLVSTSSDSFGAYNFANLPNGGYRVQASVPGGWVPTTPTIISINLFNCGANIAVDYGFMQATPTPYPTALPTQTPIIIVITPLPTNTIAPTNTVPPTNTLVPTNTLAPTNTPPPTNTTAPSNTPPPTNTTAPTNTPTATSVPSSVTNVTANATPPSSTNCNQTFTFTGSITANSPSTVQYQWVRSTGASGSIQSLTFLAPGTQNVNPDSWHFSAVGPFNFSGWDQLNIVNPAPTPTPQPTPSGSPSNRANFTLVCP